MAPSQVCEQLKKMVKSSNPDLTKVGFLRNRCVTIRYNKIYKRYTRYIYDI